MRATGHTTVAQQYGAWKIAAAKQCPGMSRVVTGRGGRLVGKDGAPLSIVFLGQRGRGKSHIMALLHHAVESPDAVTQWAGDWGAKLGANKLSQLKIQTGFLPCLTSDTDKRGSFQ